MKARTPFFRLLTLFAPVAFVVAAAAPAGAAAPEQAAARVAVLPISIEGEVSKAAVERIESSLLEGIESTGAAVVPPGEITAVAPHAANCSAAECLTEIANKVDASHAMRLEVTADGRDYDLSLLVGAANGTSSSSSAECVICGFEEVATMALDEAAALADKVSEGEEAASVTIKTTPEGAQVSIDGEPVGTAPLSHPLAPGKHRITVSHHGYITRESRIVAVEGMSEVLKLELNPLPEAPSNGRKLRIAGWTLFGTGTAALAPGVALLVLHHQSADHLCTDDADIDVEGRCRWRFNTVAGGATMTALGAAGIITGLTMAIIGHRRGKAMERLTVAPTGTGVLLRVRY